MADTWKVTILTAILLLLLSSPAGAGIVYYKDAAGNLHAAESIDQIPPEFREKTKTLESRTQESGRLTLKLRRVGNSLLVPVSFGEEGLEALLVLDTGASITLIPKRIAERLKLPALRTIELQTVSGVAAAPVVEVPVMAVKHFSVKKARVAVYDMPHGGPAEGLLGLDFLNNFHVTMDSLNGVVHLDKK